MDFTQRNSISERLLFWSFCMMFFFIPLATSPTVIVGALALAIWIFSGRLFKDKKGWLTEKWTLAVIVFMILPWIGLLWTEDLRFGLDFAKKSYYWLYAFAIASVGLTSRSITTLLNAFLAGLSIISIISLLQFTGLVPSSKWIPSIFSGKSITASLLLVFGVLVLSFYFSKAKNIKSKCLIISIMLIFFLTLSIGIGRVGYLAFILLSPLIAYNLLRRKHFIKVIAVAVLFIGVMLFSPTVQNRLSLVVNDVKLYHQGNPNTSFGLRLHMWDGAIKIFLENPIIGTGTGGYQLAMRRYETAQLVPECRDFAEPHNSYLYMAANFGIIGLISLFWLFGVLLKNGWQNRHSITGFSILSFTLVLMIGSLTGTQILSLATAMLFALFTGMQRHLNERQ